MGSVWGLVRIAGIIVGTATLLRLALMEGLVTYEPIFQAWMDRLRDIIELGFLTDVIERGLLAAFERVRGFGIPVPELQPEWRPTFILTALLIGAIVRHTPTALSIFLSSFGVLTALTVAGLTGNVLFSFLIICVWAYIPDLILFDRNFDWEEDVIRPILTLGALAVLGIFGRDFSDRFGIFLVFSVVASFGIVFIVGSVRWRTCSLISNQKFNTGIDILGTMGLALGLAAIFADPPIW